MGYKIESRRQVESDADKRGKEGTKKQTELTNTREDKETAAATAKELNQAGTKEGRDAVRRAMEAVGEKIDSHYDKRSGEAKVVSDQAAEASGTLRGAKEQTKADSKRVTESKRRLKERESGAEAELDGAARAADEEAFDLEKIEKLEKEIEEDIKRLDAKEKELIAKAKVKTKDARG